MLARSPLYPDAQTPCPTVADRGLRKSGDTSRLWPSFGPIPCHKLAGPTLVHAARSVDDPDASRPWAKGASATSPGEWQRVRDAMGLPHAEGNGGLVQALVRADGHPSGPGCEGTRGIGSAARHVVRPRNILRHPKETEKAAYQGVVCTWPKQGEQHVS